MKILFLGISGFPKGLASIDKQRLLAKGLMKKGYQVEVVCSFGVHLKNEFKRSNSFEGIKYRYTSLFSYRPQNFFLRRLNQTTSKFLETLFLIFQKQDSSIALSRNFFHVLIYKLISKAKNIPSNSIAAGNPCLVIREL
jgi:hypothetical protein